MDEIPKLPIVLINGQLKVDGELSNTKRRRMTGHDVMDLKDQIVANFSQLYLSAKLSDITIKVDKETIAAHKMILGINSDFFDRLFSSPMMESTQSEVELKETDPRVFRLLLKLTYFGHLDFSEMSPEDIIRVFSLIHRYQFIGFEEPYLMKIKSFVDKSNLWPLFDTSVECQSTDCLDICLSYLNTLADFSLLHLDAFLQLSFDSIKTLLLQDALHPSLSEVQLFLATDKWLKVNKVSDESRKELIQCLRPTLMRYEDLMNHVFKSPLVSESQVLDVMRIKGLSDNWPKEKQRPICRRAFCVEDTNFCDPNFNYEVVAGQVGNSCGPTDANSPQIVIKLGFPMNINYIELKLSDLRGDRYSYKLTYSVEGIEWKTLLDYTNYTTANFQKIHFEPIVAQLIRISGTHQLRMDSNTREPFSQIMSVICRFNQNQHMVERINGLLANPYWIRQSVQQRVYHDSNSGPNAAINGPNNGQSPCKYYSRKLASNKPIIVALDQPVIIDSFQFQLYDRDERAYSYVVEMKDRNEWIKLSDKSGEKCRSLQTITFTRRPISLVRVKATQIHNVECAEFRITKFHFPRIGSMF